MECESVIHSAKSEEHIAILSDGSVLDRFELDRAYEEADDKKAWRRDTFAGEIRCPGGSRLVWVRGTEGRVTHFRHHAKTTRGGSGTCAGQPARCGCGESAAHLHAKKIVCDAINSDETVILKRWGSMCSDPSHASTLELRGGDWKAQHEKHIPGSAVRPDVLVTHRGSGERVIIEIHHTHATEPGMKAGIPVWEISASHVLSSKGSEYRCTPLTSLCEECKDERERRACWVTSRATCLHHGRLYVNVDYGERDTFKRYSSSHRWDAVRRRWHCSASEFKLDESHLAALNTGDISCCLKCAQKSGHWCSERGIEEHQRRQRQCLEQEREEHQRRQRQRLEQEREEHQRRQRQRLEQERAERERIEREEKEKMDQIKIDRAERWEAIALKGAISDVKGALKGMFCRSGGTASECRRRLEYYASRLRRSIGAPP